MEEKNKIGCLGSFIVLLVIIYVVLIVMKFFISVTLKIAWFGLIVLLIMWLFKEIFWKNK